MNFKKVLKVLLVLFPSALIFLFYFLFLNEDGLKVIEDETDKITILLITNEECEDCQEQEEIFNKVKEESENNLFKYEVLSINSPMYKDAGAIFKVNSYPTIVSVAPNGTLLYSSSNVHNEVKLERVKNVSYERYSELLNLKKEDSKGSEEDKNE